MDALEAFALLRPSCPDVHLVLAGAAKFVGKHRRYDTLAYRDALMARAARSDLRGHAHVVGDVPDVAALYSAATLLVVPSWAEPFGRVVIEAMAAGCPVLATQAGGIPEIITHGVDGWLVQPRDPTGLARGMLLLLGDRPLRDQLSHNGAIAVQERFSLSDYMEKMERVIIEAAAARCPVLPTSAGAALRRPRSLSKSYRTDSCLDCCTCVACHGNSHG
jgi:glycosyltransferase involved in cell wall biosynthesis